MVDKEVVCPGCGTAVQVGNSVDVEVVRCGECGRLASVGEMLASAVWGNAQVFGTVEKPAGTKIVRRELKNGAVGWEVPASGKSGGAGVGEVGRPVGIRGDLAGHLADGGDRFVDRVSGR